MKYTYLAVFILVGFIFTGCKKSTEEFSTPPISDYAPLTQGKYITYQIDSLIYINFGTLEVTHTYQVKYLTDSLITDNLGRPAYRIFRYIRSDASSPWESDATFLAVNTGSSLEFTENNMRFIKLKQPIRNDYAWLGNSYIDTYSFGSEVRYLADWSYTYQNVAQADVVGSFNLDNTITINQRNETIGNPDDPNSYSEKNFGLEKYALGIGMVYKKFLHYEYQPPTTTQGGYYVGYGVTLTMIDHN